MRPDKARQSEKKTRSRKSTKRKTLTEEEYAEFEALKEYLSLPPGLRPRHPLLGSISLIPNLKKHPGRRIEDPVKKAIEDYFKKDPEFAERINDCLATIEGSFSIKSPKLSDLREEIITKIPSLKLIDPLYRTKVREFLRDRQNLLRRRLKH